jgi:hypothetical protein
MASKSAFHRPQLKLEEFFDGSVKGFGFMHTRFGKLAQQFDISAEGPWNGKTLALTLTETYQFDDGHRDNLNWQITKLSETRYRGVEDRVKGEAEGEQSAHHFRWRYVRDVPQKGGKTTRLTFDDCFYLQSPNLLMARASVSRFGFEIGVITVSYVKP